MKRLDPLGLVLLLFAMGNMANALWMLASPPHWYVNLPASVPDFGPLNEHFVRDLGGMFFVFGSLLGWAAFSRQARSLAIATVTLWYGVHSVVHIFDTARGLVGREHFWIDLPLVYVPAAVLFGLLWWHRREGA